MEQTFERVMRRDEDGNSVPEKHLYRRRYKNGDGVPVTRFYALFTDWQGIRRRFALGDKLESARRKLAGYLKKNDAEVDFDEEKAERQAKQTTFSQWAAECTAAMKPRDWTILPHLERHFGGAALSKIDDNAVLDYRKERGQEGIIRQGKARERTVSPTTINKELGLLRKLLRLALAKNRIRRLPKFVMTKEPSRDRVLTPQEYAELIKCAPQWLSRVVVAARETALSRGDLLGLTWDEVKVERDRNGNKVKVIKTNRDKSGVRQEIPIVAETLVSLFAELEAEYRRLPNMDNLVFTHDGQRIKNMQLRRALQRACKQAGISNFTFHDLRHCAITTWHAMGIPPSHAMRMAGHTSVQSHKKYVNLGTQDLIDVLLTSCEQKISRVAEKSVSA